MVMAYAQEDVNNDDLQVSEHKHKGYGYGGYGYEYPSYGYGYPSYSYPSYGYYGKGYKGIYILKTHFRQAKSTKCMLPNQVTAKDTAITVATIKLLWCSYETFIPLFQCFTVAWFFLKKYTIIAKIIRY